MRKFLVIAALAGVTLVGCDDDDPTGPDIETLVATLTGAAEAPGPGDPNGTGTAEIELNDDDNEVCWDIQVANITLPAAAAHIHEAPVGVSGPVVVTLSAPLANGTAQGCVGATDEQVDDIIANPADYYVNVHTSDYPAGAVRGQLSN